MRRIRKNPTKQQLLRIGRVPKVGDIMTTHFCRRLAVITSVRWLPIMCDYGVDFMFLDKKEYSCQPLKYVNLK